MQKINNDKITDKLKNRIKNNYLLNKNSWFGIGGCANTFFQPNNKEELILFLKNINFDLEKFGKKIVKNSNTEVVIAKNEKNLEIFLQKNHSSKEIVIAMGAGSVSQWIRSISKKIKNAKN